MAEFVYNKEWSFINWGGGRGGESYMSFFSVAFHKNHFPERTAGVIGTLADPLSDETTSIVVGAPTTRQLNGT